MDYRKLLLLDKEMAARYKELGKKATTPYFYKITNGKQLLCFVGCEHTFDDTHAELDVITKLWKEFLDKTGGKDCVVMVEGRVTAKDPELMPVAGTMKEIVNRSGEGGYALYLAAQFAIPAYSPEPDRKTEMEQLAKQLSKDELMYYYFARQAAQWHREHYERAEFEPYMQHTLDVYKRIMKWPDFDFTMSNLTRLHDQLHKHAFKIDDLACFRRDANPITNKAASASSLLRDAYILTEIKRQWGAGKNIFIVFGSGHAIKQERALKQLLTGTYAEPGIELLQNIETDGNQQRNKQIVEALNT